MKRPFKDVRPVGPAFSQDGLDSFGGPRKERAKPGDGVYRLSYIIETDKSKDEIRKDVESAVKSMTGVVGRGADNIVVDDIFVNRAGMSKYDVEIRFLPDVENTLEAFVSQELVDGITDELDSIPGYNVNSNWKLDFLVTK